MATELPLGGPFQRFTGARHFLAIVRGDGHLVGAQPQAVDIGLVAIKILRIDNRMHGLRRHLVFIARTKANDEQLSSHVAASRILARCFADVDASGLPVQPGTRTIEKYGAASSAFCASGMVAVLAMVPRST